MLKRSPDDSVTDCSAITFEINSTESPSSSRVDLGHTITEANEGTRKDIAKALKTIEQDRTHTVYSLTDVEDVLDSLEAHGIRNGKMTVLGPGTFQVSW